ncbi:hypothetical protein BO71DRAFT_416231 [Aspergillus ellipticus CBS 707.79]|uniref:Uncharacterized protein n=1 Tax=Aspergillus ellipticus CBS 707.79 TaxID=1448320 RepID=A0A319DM60_9EURO|nr:hypothetical protein BO71DRAFT_416231 [Aspergillus ellipticus CBS 707.79]
MYSKPGVCMRKKRQTHGSLVNIRRKAKADRKQFRRGKRGVYKRLNNLYLDGLDTGREVRIYTLFMRKPKGYRVNECWLKFEAWSPSNFDSNIEPRNRGAGSRNVRLFSISKPPSLVLPGTPSLDWVQAAI